MITDILESKGLKYTILDSFIQLKISPDEIDPAKITAHEALLKI